LPGRVLTKVPNQRRRADSILEMERGRAAQGKKVNVVPFGRNQQKQGQPLGGKGRGGASPGGKGSVKGVFGKKKNPAKGLKGKKAVDPKDVETITGGSTLKEK